MIKALVACILLFITMIPLMEDVVTAKKNCSCSKLIFSSKNVGELKDILTKTYSSCENGVKYEILEGVKLRTPMPCDSGILQRLIDIQWGLRCFEESHCVNLMVSSGKFVTILTALYLGYATLGAIFILLSVFGYGKVGTSAETLYLKSRISMFCGFVWTVLGYRGGQFMDMFSGNGFKFNGDAYRGRKRGTNGRYLKRIAN